MKKRIHQACAVLLIVIGVIHMALTPFLGGVSEVQALWFVGTGLAFTFLGIGNIIWLSSLGHSAMTQALFELMNIAGLIFLTWAFSVLREPQVLSMLVLMLAITIPTVWRTVRDRTRQCCSRSRLGELYCQRFCRS